MQINFIGHSPTERKVELSPQDLQLVFETMKSKFLTHIEYSSVYDRKPSYIAEDDQGFYDLCEAHGVDIAYSKDRISFFQAIVEKFKNPYQ